ncbi:MAG: FmdB family zinc ribbon protein [Gemmataceae bacterium]
MPTYDYVCDACDHKFEEFQSMLDKPLKKCPKCRKQKLRRLFGSGAAVIFKGGGFYQTDYRSESYNASAKADQDSASAASSKESAASNSPAPTTDTSTPGSGSNSKPAAPKSSKSKD